MDVASFIPTLVSFIPTLVSLIPTLVPKSLFPRCSSTAFHCKAPRSGKYHALHVYVVYPAAGHCLCSARMHSSLPRMLAPAFRQSVNCLLSVLTRAPRQIVMEEGGLDLVTSLASSEDPDVQRMCVEALSFMCVTQGVSCPTICGPDRCPYTGTRNDTRREARLIGPDRCLSHTCTVEMRCIVDVVAFFRFSGILGWSRIQIPPCLLFLLYCLTFLVFSFCCIS